MPRLLSSMHRRRLSSSEQRAGRLVWCPYRSSKLGYLQASALGTSITAWRISRPVWQPQYNRNARIFDILCGGSVSNLQGLKYENGSSCVGCHCAVSRKRTLTSGQVSRSVYTELCKRVLSP